MSSNVRKSSSRRANTTEDDIAPACCMSQRLPVHRRIVDPTITSAPVIAPTKSECCCIQPDYNTGYPSQDMLGRTYLPQGAPISSPEVNISMQRRNVPAYQGGQQMNPISPHPSRDTTYSPGKIQTQPRNVIYPSVPSRSRFETTQNVAAAEQQQRTQSINRPIGFDPRLMERTYDSPSRPLGFEEYATGQPNETVNRPLGFEGYQTMRKDKPSYHPLGFEHLMGRNEKTFKSPVGYTQPYAGSNITRGPLPVRTTAKQQSSSGWIAADDQSSSYPDLGPWRNFNIPQNIKRVNIASSANKTYPKKIVPPPSRYYSTYDDDSQPIFNVREVAMHRRRAPRFHSTPTEVDFANEGTNISSVWGQDLDSMRQTQTSSFVDSSLGWSKGVRMDSFNVLSEMTPSPKNVRGPPRLNASYRPVRYKEPDPGSQKTHTYIQNPYAHVEYLAKIPLGADIAAVNPRARGRVLQKTAVRSARSTSPTNRQANRTQVVRTPRNETPCQPCGNTTYSVDGTSSKSAREAPDRTISVSKRVDQTGQQRPEAGKDFCTVLEIRTPCGNNPSQSDKPLQLSINVTCADPSLLVTPDKRCNVITQRSAPEVSSAPGEPDNELNAVPSDCDCV